MNNNKCKLFVIILALILTVGMLSQINNTVNKNNLIYDKIVPSTTVRELPESSLAGIYNLASEDKMNITSNENNYTKTELNSLTGNCSIDSNKYQDNVRTLINDTYMIGSGHYNAFGGHSEYNNRYSSGTHAGHVPSTRLKDLSRDFDVNISHDFYPYTPNPANDISDLIFEETNHNEMGLLDFRVNGVPDPNNEYLQYFKIYSGDFSWYITYSNYSFFQNQLYISHAASNMLISLKYNYSEQSLTFVDGILYRINGTGLYSSVGSLLASWEDEEAYYNDKISFTFLNHSLIVYKLGNYSITITKTTFSGVNLFGINFVSKNSNFPLSFYWQKEFLTINLGRDDIMTFNVFLKIEENLIYSMFWEHWSFEVKFFTYYCAIEWRYLTLDIMLWEIDSYDYWYWVINFQFHRWTVKLEHYLVKYSTSGNFLMKNYEVFLDYIRYATFYTYRYKVPTVVLPNQVFVSFIEQVFNEDKFYFRLFLLNAYGERLSILDNHIDINWNGTLISELDFNFATKVYNFTVDAVLVSPEEDPIPLSIIIDSMSFPFINYTTYLAVDPASVIDERPNDILPVSDGDDDDDGNIDSSQIGIFLGITLVIIIAISISVFGIIYWQKPEMVKGFIASIRRKLKRE
ncbi:MAG: hypothetical protein GF329_07885 [Candidatus Lokiarchaeota archaeon]|nr:hypothetical protein [Candidatus Lokiarchaeota archaeon]